MRIIRNTAVLLGAGIYLCAGATDYSRLEGKCGAALKSAVKEIAAENLATVSYGDDTWEAFEKTDMRVVAGRQAWFDMYSNQLVYVADGHNGMNIEHSVANSWWGGLKNNAYKDLYHLNPSNSDANNRKSDKPLGEITGAPTWSNGLTNIGAPTLATGGGASSVFEPADEFKGDFARAYFYIFTLYDEIAWQDAPAYMYELTAYPTLKPWATDMLLRWAADDPVDEREIGRARAVAGIQMNVNPYVEIPGLAEYVWGDKKTTPFKYSTPVYAPNRPEAPTFGSYTLDGVNTWSGRWWDAFNLTISADAPEIYYTFTDSDEYQLYTGPVTIGAAGVSGETVSVKAFARTTYNGRDYDSSVATLTLTSREIGATDYMHATWQKMKAGDSVDEEGLYLIVPDGISTVMSCVAKSTKSSGYIETAGEPTVSGEKITWIPESTGIMKFIPAGASTYYVSVNDVTLKNVGQMEATAAKKLRLSEEGTPAQVRMLPDHSVSIDLGSTFGTVQYNKQSPRFSVYTTSQGSICLYRCVDNSSGVTTECVGLPGADEVAPVWYDLQGRRVDITSAESGLYIKVTPQGSEKIRK